MATKKAVTVKKSIPLNFNGIEIDMKLTQKDLCDALVHKRESDLNEEYTNINIKITNLKNEIKDIDTKIDAYSNKLLTTTFKKKIDTVNKAMKALLPNMVIAITRKSHIEGLYASLKLIPNEDVKNIDDIEYRPMYVSNEILSIKYDKKMKDLMIQRDNNAKDISTARNELNKIQKILSDIPKLTREMKAGMMDKILSGNADLNQLLLIK